MAKVCEKGDQLDLEVHYVKDIDIVAFGYAYETLKSVKKLTGTVVQTTPQALDVVTNSYVFVDNVTIDDEDDNPEHIIRSEHLDLPAGTLLSFKRFVPEASSGKVPHYQYVGFLDNRVRVVFTGEIRISLITTATKQTTQQSRKKSQHSPKHNRKKQQHSGKKQQQSSKKRQQSSKKRHSERVAQQRGNEK